MGRFPKGSWKFDGCKGSFFLRGANNIIWYRRSRSERFTTGLVYSQKNKLLAGQRIQLEENGGGQKNKNKITIAEAWIIYNTQIEHKTNITTRTSYDLAYRRFFTNDSWLVTDNRIKDLIEKLKNEDLGNNTKNAYLNAMRIFFNFLLENGYLSTNPIKKSTFTKVKPKSIEIFTPDELLSIFDFAKENNYQYYLFLRFLHLTAFRVQEVLKLTIASVRVGKEWRKQIILGSSKYGNKVDLFPLTPAVIEILEQTDNIDNPDPKTLVFSIGKIGTAQNRLKEIFEALEIPKSTTPNSKGYGRSFHTFRKTRITEWILQGISVHGLEKLSRDNYNTVRKYYDAVQTDSYDEFVK